MQKNIKRERGFTQHHSSLRSSGAGFTLLEIVLVTAIFALTAVLAVDIFLVMTKLQRKTVTSQRLQGDARFVMELIAKDVRLGQIDYAFYDELVNFYHFPMENALGELVSPLPVLALRNAQGESIVYRRTDADGFLEWADWDDPSGNGIEVCIGDCLMEGNAVWETITPQGIKVVSANFYIQPSVTPFVPVAGAFMSDKQPLVTIQIGTQGSGSKIEEQGFIFLQTTASTRIYER